MSDEDGMKCTDEVLERLCKALESGLPLRPACESAGISRDTVYGWREQAKAGVEPYASAWARIRKARGVLQATLVGRILTLARVGTKDDATKLNATKWALEKLYPEDFGNRVELSGPGGGPIQTKSGSDDELLTRLARLADRPGGPAGGHDPGRA